MAFASHHWPTWGKANIRQFLANQRDTYRFIHDRALNLANRGETMKEIGNASFFPKGLAADASSHGYYGTLSHNLRAVYNYYLGFYDGNPATLDPLTRVDAAKRYVAAMGGEAAVVAIGRKAVADGDYRWAVELMNHAAFANPDNTEARSLQADALEQLGYQAESATWRNAYLMGALELRAGAQKMGQSTSGPDVVRGMTNELLWDYVALRLNHEKTDGLKADISVEFTDVNEVWALELSNSVLNSTKGRVLKNPDLKVTMTRPALLAMAAAGQEVARAGAGRPGQAVEGDPTRALENNVLTFDPIFTIVAP